MRFNLTSFSSPRPARGALALIAGGALSLFLLTGCFQTDTGDASAQSAQVKGKSETTPVPANPDIGQDTLHPICGTPDPVPGSDPLLDPIVVPTPEVITPADNGDFAPIDWSATALPGSEGWRCMESSPAVCGDNGKTYRNVCEAAWSGQHVKSEGRCP